MSEFKKDFLEVMKEVGELANNLGISEIELENILLAFSQPTSEDVGEMTRELLNKLNGKLD